MNYIIYKVFMLMKGKKKIAVLSAAALSLFGVALLAAELKSARTECDIQCPNCGSYQVNHTHYKEDHVLFYGYCRDCNYSWTGISYAD